MKLIRLLAATAALVLGNACWAAPSCQSVVYALNATLNPRLADPDALAQTLTTLQQTGHLPIATSPNARRKPPAGNRVAVYGAYCRAKPSAAIALATANDGCQPGNIRKPILITAAANAARDA